jgi:hypothetical protein
VEGAMKEWLMGDAEPQLLGLFVALVLVVVVVNFAALRTGAEYLIQHHSVYIDLGGHRVEWR